MRSNAPMRHADDEPPRTRSRQVQRAARMALYPRSTEATRAKLDRLIQYARSHERALILTQVGS